MIHHDLLAPWFFYEIFPFLRSSNFKFFPLVMIQYLLQTIIVVLLLCNSYGTIFIHILWLVLYTCVSFLICVLLVRAVFYLGFLLFIIFLPTDSFWYMMMIHLENKFTRTAVFRSLIPVAGRTFLFKQKSRNKKFTLPTKTLNPEI